MMKTHVRFLSFTLCLVVLFASLSPSCFAVSNTIIGSSPAAETYSFYGQPGPADIRATSNSDKVVYPDSGSYFSDYVVYYINAPKKDSVYAYAKPSAKADKPRVAYHGSRVIGIAAQSGLTCVLYYDINLEYRTAWITSSNLSTVFPGKTITIDNSFGGSSRQLYPCGDAVLSWSRDNFVGSQEKYALLDYAREDISQFTVDYHVAARGESRSSGGWKGPRTIYVNDGSGWTAVGSFEYNATEVVHAVVTLSSPMTIAAVAVIADCEMPWAITTRVALLDMYCE